MDANNKTEYIYLSVFALYYPARYFITQHLTDALLFGVLFVCWLGMHHNSHHRGSQHSDARRLTAGPRRNAPQLSIHRQELLLNRDKHISLYPVHQKQPEQTAMVQLSKHHKCLHSPKNLFQERWHPTGSCSWPHVHEPRLLGNNFSQDKDFMCFHTPNCRMGKSSPATGQEPFTVEIPLPGCFGAWLSWKVFVPCSLPCFLMPKVTQTELAARSLWFLPW